MRLRAAILAIFLPNVLPGVEQADSPQGSVVLKSNAHVVQLDVVVSDSSGRPIHGLQKNDFVLTDNGHPRDIRIFSGEINATAGAPSPATSVAAGMYSNRIAMQDSPMVMAIVIDAVRRPESLQKKVGFIPDISWFPNWFAITSMPAKQAIRRMEPGQMIAIYAACPELRLVQDYTSNPDRLIASLDAFVPPRVSDPPVKNQPKSLDALVPPMLAALREAASRMSGASGRKSIVWLSQAYGSELNASALDGVSESTIQAFNDANVTLYAVDTRNSPVCERPPDLPRGQAGMVSLTCTIPADISDEWMDYLARATGGRGFSGGVATGAEERNADGRVVRGYRSIQTDHSLVTDALRFAAYDSRNAYEMGFYVPESELDGTVHLLEVTVRGKPRLVLRYRTGYTASSVKAQGVAKEPAENSGEVGIDGTASVAAKNGLRVSLAIDPKTLGRTADGVVVFDATITQTDELGKQLASVQETVRPEAASGMVPYARVVKLINGAILLHITIRDPASNRSGSIAIPIGKH
jgi:hypothetical protein